MLLIFFNKVAGPGPVCFVTPEHVRGPPLYIPNSPTGYPIPPPEAQSLSSSVVAQIEYYFRYIFQ